MSVGSWFRNIGNKIVGGAKKLGRKVSGGLKKFGRDAKEFGKGFGRGMGKVFGTVGDGIKKGTNLIESVPIVGDIISNTGIGKGLKGLGTGLRASRSVLKGDIGDAWKEVKSGVKQIALGKLGKLQRVAKFKKYRNRIKALKMGVNQI